MDLKTREALRLAGVELARPELLQVPIQLRKDGRPKPLGEEVAVVDNSWTMAHLKLEPISRLWTATGTMPSPQRTAERHEAFLILLESTASIYCTTVQRPETDAEFERLYRQLCRNPDGCDAHPLFGYLQGAARLYLSLRDVSRAEYEILTDRLRTLAGIAHTHVGSTNYHRVMLSGADIPRA